ncbi:CRTAC1 family protein [Streptosporangiaceae bacterium NEAU-GS5]|nr:CRTAC1 family protein [Streptosporangiaceae bacterium NEAU-GS5]
MSAQGGRITRQLPGILALAALIVVYFVVRLPTHSAAELQKMASRYSFEPMSVQMPGGYKQQTVRQVNQDYQHIDAWISSVGSGISLNDLDGDGLSNDLCTTDPRIDQVVVAPAPTGTTPRYASFALNPGALPMNGVMAPMGCLPADLNEDGRMDLLVYYWGRTPIAFIQKATPPGTKLEAACFQPTEMVPGVDSVGGVYHGPQWNTNAVAFDDFDGDGHEDLFIGNYFPDGPVLDPSVSGGVVMDDSLSHAFNGGTDHFFRWTASGWQELDDVLPTDVSKGWELAAAATDLDGDQLPELYLANDFGPDRMLHNVSTPGKIRFDMVESGRSPITPRSKLMGIDSFKGMGIDYGDLNGDGVFDMFVSNITTSFGIQESNFAWMSTVKDLPSARAWLDGGHTPWRDDSAGLGLAWSGWGWDTKIDDFDNSGTPAIVQTTGFVKGDVNRWPQLQEEATANDVVTHNPWWWPNVQPGDDIAGSQTLHFYAKDDQGRYADVAGDLGLAVPVPTRGIATGDVDGDGRLDFAVARQWDAPVFYHNVTPGQGSFLNLQLTHAPATGATKGSPAVDAQVCVTMPDGSTKIARVDGGSGHSGKRSNDVHIGLGSVTGAVQVHLRWRDRTGQVHEQDLRLTPGRHALQLDAQAKEA